VAATFLVTAAHYAVGPPSIAVVVLYVEAPIFAVYLLHRPLAIAMYVLVDVQFGFVVTTQPGYAFPLVQFLFFAVVLASIGGIIGGLLAHGVAEAQRLARFRRFLAQPVADAVLAAGDDEMLEPHRRRIAVFFCDLRGFTRFSSASEPEEVVEVLDDYYHTVGELLHEHGATVGSFAGDGIMAYFGDPVRIDDPAERAVQLALQLRDPMDALMRDWKRRGFELSYGIGIAYGYATLGVVGFKGRYDYTALGSVVNLAARLSDHADACEVLVDERTFQALDIRLDSTPRALILKGFDEPVNARCLSRPTSDVLPLDRQRGRPA
jgi:class 3 adenylate cyclase